MSMLTFDQIIQIIDRQEESNILLAALDLKIFTVLNKSKLTAVQVARKARTNIEGTELLLNALAVMGALHKKGAIFSNTTETYRHFCAHSKDYKKGMVMLKIDHRGEWDKLIRTVRDGRSLADYEEEEDPEFRRLFSYSMHERSDYLSDKVAEFVTRFSVGRMLDLGAGPGSYSAAILKRDKKARAVLFDRPIALNVAREIAVSMKLSHRIEFIEGDLFDTEYGDGYQTIFFSNILHIYNEQQNKTLFKKIYEAMEPGGRFIIGDLFLENNRLKPYDAALFSLTMLLYTARGRTYSFGETECLLKSTGFYKFKRLKMAGGNSLLEAFKK